MFDLKQIESAVNHEGINNLRKLSEYKHTNKAELVILFDEKSCTVEDGGAEINLMLRINPKSDDMLGYPSKTVVSQQFKECKEMIASSKRKQLRTLCENILKQEPLLKQVRFVVLRAETKNLDRTYRAETLLTISRKG